MLRRSNGQSLVEMAFILPLLLVIIFGIIDMGWLVFAYSTIGQAARNGAEVAAQNPPFESWLAYQTAPPTDANYSFLNDLCVNTVMQAIESDAVFFNSRINLNGGRNIGSSSYVSMRYPTTNTRDLEVRGPIEITINYPVQPLTPLFRLLRIGNQGGLITMRSTVRRSLEGLGTTPITPDRSACFRDMADYNARRR